MSIIFNGATCYAVGNAHLSLVAGKLRVSNIGTSGLDGIMVTIPTSGTGNNVSIKHNKFLEYNEGHVTISYLYKNKDGVLFTRSENYEERVGNEIKYAYNPMLLSPNSFKAKGILNGINVFDEEIENPFNPPPPPTQPVAFLSYLYYGLGALYYAYKLLTSSPPSPTPAATNTIEASGNGRIVKTDGTIVEYNGTYKDPIPVDIELIPAQTTYQVDTWGVESIREYPPTSGVQPLDFPKLSAVVFYVKGLSQFDIEEIVISPITIQNL